MGCYDEMTQALFDQLNEEKTEEYFEEYSEREDEYDGDMKRSYDRNATLPGVRGLKPGGHASPGAAAASGYTNGSIPGVGTVSDYLKSISYGSGRNSMELYLQNCEDDSDAYDKFQSRMMDRYDQKADRKYLPEYYRKIGIAHREEGGKHFFLIIMLR